MAKLSERDLIKLTRQLYPTGRAWNIPVDSNLEKLHVSINKAHLEAVQGMIGQLDSILADNDNFTEQDATDWERRLQLVTSSLTSLEDRKLAILRKYSHPGNIKARGHYLVLQGQLRAAGFDVYVHENNPANDSPSSFPFYASAGQIQLGQVQLGQSGLARTSIDLVANYIDKSIDSQFDIGGDLRHCLFIGGAVKGEGANVPAIREDEFRQLLLTLKFANSVAVLFINYV